MVLGLVIALIVLVLDQISKYVVYSMVLTDVKLVVIVPFFNIIEAWNTGVSFSMFHGNGMIGAILLSLLALVIVGFLLNWLRKEKDKSTQVALGFIIGGALGNVIDRIRFGAVFDFLDVYVGSYHWPTFNVADSFVCIGAFMIIFSSFFKKKNVEA